MTLSTLKRGLVLFWSIWFTAALATNVVEGLKVLGIGRRSWPFASGNYKLIKSVGAKFSSPPWSGGVFFGAVLIWELLAACQFWRATRTYGGTATENLDRVDAAFATSLGLWASFMIADEVFVAYETGVEAPHMRVFTAELATLLGIHLLPD